MGATPDIALIEQIVRQRLDEILPQKIEEKLAEMKANKTPSMTIIATKGTLDWAYPPFILASTAAALGWDVSIFFTFYGLQPAEEGHLRPQDQPARQSGHADENALRPGLVQGHQLEHPQPGPGRHPRLRVLRHHADAADDQEQRRCAMLGVLAGTGVLRGLQDTRTPLAVAVGANLMNIVLNAVLVLGLGWGLAGSAWGTVAAQNAAAAAYLAIVARGARRAGVAFGPDRAGVRAAAVAGAALVVRTLSLQAVLVVTTAMAARMGDDAIAAHQIAFRLWTLLAFALDAIAIAGQAITGRYLGAGDVAGARAATRRMTGWGAVYGLMFGALLLAARPFLPAVFAVTPGVAGLLLAVLLVAAVQQPIAGVVFVLDGVLIGAGDQNYLALAGMAATAVFAVAALCVHAAGGGLVALWLALSLWMAARFVTLTLRARDTAWLVTGAVRRWQAGAAVRLGAPWPARAPAQQASSSPASRFRRIRRTSGCGRYRIGEAAFQG